ncbi:2-acylglycerol O-acyltransferase 2-like [Myzus persicae]|uniref:2-acylglycerol O-acyltransferase 2-like n=1 Tax=Myzus persicae TaxID=13164 RepID=UPI000B9374CE|nr:2-acylglycerol O-acyltransferase 2-like [Myzus persicae]
MHTLPKAKCKPKCHLFNNIILRRARDALHNDDCVRAVLNLTRSREHSFYSDDYHLRLIRLTQLLSLVRSDSAHIDDDDDDDDDHHHDDYETRFVSQRSCNFKIPTMKLKDVEFAPLCVPFRRRLETLAAAGWIYLVVFGGLTGWAIFLYILMATRFWWAALLYAVYMYLDRSVAWSHPNRFRFIRRLGWWTHFKNYFPVSLVKTHELPADKSYLFAAYPHGVLCAGSFSNFATDAGQFSELFPGLTSYLITLSLHFCMPFSREIGIGLCLQESSEKSLMNLLDNKKGNVAVLMVGGVSEAFKSFPGPYHLILKNRKGFIRVALQTGASLVPVFSFGETNVYGLGEAEPNSFWDKVLKLIKWKSGNKVPVGRGFFQYSFGIVPRRHPIVTVVGKPIDVPKIVKPEKEDIEKYHRIFIDELTKLFEENKTKYSKHPDEMELILD